MIDLAWLEHIACGFEVPFDNCPENLRQKPHLIQIDLVFKSRTSCGSYKIAKSCNAQPGMTVSKSTTHIPSPELLCNRTLFSLVSL